MYARRNLVVRAGASAPRMTTMKARSILTAMLALGLLASCNTMRGAGRDVQAGGAAVENAATDVQEDMKKSNQTEPK